MTQFHEDINDFFGRDWNIQKDFLYNSLKRKKQKEENEKKIKLMSDEMIRIYNEYKEDVIMLNKKFLQVYSIEDCLNVINELKKQL